MKRIGYLTLAYAVVAFSGCTSVSTPKSSAVSIVVEPAQNDAVESLAAKQRPSNYDRVGAPAPYRSVQAQPEPRPVVDNRPLPVWNESELVAVEMDAYVNEKGELVEPSRKWVVRKPGGWNVDAARSPERAYIPAANVAPIPQAPGSYTPYVSPGVSVSSLTPPAPKRGAVDLAGVKNVRVTGFMHQSDRTKAQDMAAPGEVLVFDPALGYLLVPQSVFMQTPVAVDGAAGVTSRPTQQPSRPSRATPKVDADEDIGQTTPQERE
jgi:hypothetical protein